MNHSKLLARLDDWRYQAQEGIQQTLTVRTAVLILAALILSSSGKVVRDSTCSGQTNAESDTTGQSLLSELAPALGPNMMEQQQQGDAWGYHAPFKLPKLIHQTVEDRRNMSCQVRESIQTWIDMNPGYSHKLYDAQDRIEFVQRHYPELLEMFLALPTNVERADTWRYLALYRLGGVYADSDVRCMQPIDTWNADNAHDAALMVGIAKRTKEGVTQEFNQFAIASMPGHPVMGAMPSIITSNFAVNFLRGVKPSHQGLHHDSGVLFRTGPGAFTQAIRQYAQRVGQRWPINSTKADLQGGIRFGTVRAMPKFVLGMGWETMDYNMTCDQVKQKLRPEAYVCHQFFGTWKKQPEISVNLTYSNCKGGLRYG